MDWYEAEVRELEMRTRLGGNPPCPAVFYGSSSIRLWDTVSADLRALNVVNRGFGGSTLAACVHFFDRLIPPLEPCSVTLYAGDNDIGDGRPAGEVIASFRAFCAKMERYLPDIPFACISIKPSPARVDVLPVIRQVNAAIRMELAARPHTIYVNVFEAMLDRAGRPRRELFLEDGLHMAPAGYKLWAERLEPLRNQLFIQPQRNSNTVSLS